MSYALSGRGMDACWVPLTAARLPQCVPLWSDRHAYTPSDFARALRRLELLLKEERAIGAVILEDDHVRGFGVSVFAEPAAVERFLAAPHPQFGKQLLLDDDVESESDAVLDGARIGLGNAMTGLQLVVVNTNYDRDAHDVDAVIGSIMGAFQAVHRGYRIARIVNEVLGNHAIDVMVTSRSFEIRQHFSDVGGVKGLSSALGTLTREQAAAWRNPLLGMFVYAPPRICFTEPEQQVLRLALAGAPDAVVAKQLQLPQTAVKGRWARLQERAFTAVPELLSGPASGRHAAGRGPQSRHVVVEYVREHPSELTPYARGHT